MLQCKEALLCRTLRRLWWVDTEDMLADGMTKGAISRRQIMDASTEGKWTLKKAPMKHEEKRYKPIDEK